MTRLLDSKFRIPGTSIRFGLDPIAGLFPVVGDAATMVVSLAMVYVMYKHGVSGRVAGKMVFNVLLDMVFGSIPVAGTVFDVFFKSNQRNLRLLKKFYENR